MVPLPSQIPPNFKVAIEWQKGSKHLKLCIFITYNVIMSLTFVATRPPYVVAPMAHLNALNYTARLDIKGVILILILLN